jgi:hypothetical protein
MPAQKPTQPTSTPATKKVVTTEKTIVTFRMPADLGNWCKEQADARGISFNEFAVSVLADLHEWYGLPDQMVAALEADCTALGLGRREYLMHLLLTRYDQVKEREPGFDRRGLERDRRKR